MDRKMDRKRTNLAIIGAGLSGILAAKEALSIDNYDVVLFEKNSVIGGIWSTEGFAWPNLDVNISKYTMDFPFSKWLSMDDIFPKKEAVFDYLENIAKTYGIINYIKFNSKVTSLSQNPDESFTLHWTDEKGQENQKVFDQVIVAAGKVNRMNFGEFEQYRNKQNGCLLDIVHTGEYLGTDPFKGKRVMVLGHGHSSAQLSSEISKVAQALVNVFRRPYFIKPRYIYSEKYGKVIPMEFLYSGSRKSRLEAEGLTAEEKLKKMKSSLHSSEQNDAHPALFIDPLSKEFHGASIADTYLSDVKNKRFDVVKSCIDRIEGNTIFLQNGQSFEMDVLLLGIGFYEDISFLDENLQKKLSYNIKNINRPLDLDLSYVYNRKIKNLAFVGCLTSPTLFITNHYQVLVAFQYLRNQDNYDEFYKRIADTKLPFAYRDKVGYLDLLAKEMNGLPDVDLIKEVDKELYEFVMEGPYLIHHYSLQKQNYGSPIWTENAEFIKKFNRDLRAGNLVELNKK